MTVSNNDFITLDIKMPLEVLMTVSNNYFITLNTKLLLEDLTKCV